MTAPNLVLSSWPPYWEFQTWMWSTFFNNRPLLATSFLGVFVCLWLSYGLLLLALKRMGSQFKMRQVLCVLLLSSSILFFANNALSYDVFNYIFNAKMVVVYHANPHIQVALDFATDPWTRFMHNTHTPAPYGYGWTFFSLLPFSLGLDKFLLTWLIFRAASVMSLVGTFGVLVWLLKKRNMKLTTQNVFSLSLVFLNPLILIEIISNSHNDLWMVGPAVVSLGVLAMITPALKTDGINKKKWWLIISAVLLVVSISIKLATAVLLPVWVGMTGLALLNRELLKPSKMNAQMKTLLDLLEKWWPVLASILLFLPLLSSRSQQFHPWYLSWCLVWVPLFPSSTTSASKKIDQFFHALSEIWIYILIALSFTSLLRYLPFLLAGEYTDQVQLQQKLITWSGVLLGLIMYTLVRKFKISL